MPTYEFLNTETDEQFERFMSIKHREQFLLENPHIHSLISAPAIVSYAGGDLYSKTPSGFKEVLSKVAEAHPGSNVAEKYHRKSIKEARTSEVVKKHVDRITKRYK
jgi:hypothetical protein